MRSPQSILPALIIALVAFAAHGGQAIEPRIIEHGPRGSNKVALTFDACRTGLADQYDEKVVELLLREQAKFPPPFRNERLRCSIAASNRSRAG